MTQVNPYNNMALTMQPGVVVVANQAPIVWMPKPTASSGCPPGLEYLTQVDFVQINQEIDLMELMTWQDMPNKYHLLNSMGQQIYFATEEPGHPLRPCCSQRSFIMHITDNAGMEVIRLHREPRCCTVCNCWCANGDCCGAVLSIEAPVGQTVGYVSQRSSFLSPPKFVVQDQERDDLMNIDGPCCGGMGDIGFELFSAKDGQNAGSITKQWAGMAQERMTSADNFGIKFPMHLDVKQKAALIGACLLLDAMYFEFPAQGNQRQRRR
ncbi:phospholipid scramblase 1-like [Dreissena polymorpha]|uniref:phospholipid scramblase 1-like n=1 Tax=Dreissena polymorpha TaxID=45954 RepID=UPI002264D500|nr:phospholipid scramblase 1-like [Dreissena polymorpha]